uniref:Uncharacterized protein n=1 Tax=Leersia perrieri TaxID=77586 RepID=A0A0D9V289_9ORYZ
MLIRHRLGLLLTDPPTPPRDFLYIDQPPPISVRQSAIDSWRTRRVIRDQGLTVAAWGAGARCASCHTHGALRIALPLLVLCGTRCRIASMWASHDRVSLARGTEDERRHPVGVHTSIRTYHYCPIYSPNLVERTQILRCQGNIPASASSSNQGLKIPASASSGHDMTWSNCDCCDI